MCKGSVVGKSCLSYVVGNVCLEILQDISKRSRPFTDYQQLFCICLKATDIFFFIDTPYRIAESAFDWTSYLKQTGSIAAPLSCFRLVNNLNDFFSGSDTLHLH